MKNITFIFLFLGTIGFAQNLGNPATIGQTNRNQKVGKGLQVEDTLLTKGKVIFSNLVTYGSADTFLAIKNGYLVRALSSGGGGSSALFPNGVETITTSRDLINTDFGKLLVIVADNVILTPPASLMESGESLKKITMFFLNPTEKTSGFKISTSSEISYPSTGSSDGILAAPIDFTCSYDDNELATYIFPSEVIVGSDFTGGLRQTAIAYLLDKEKRAVPNYIDDAAADADVNLLSGQTYTLTGSRNLNIKP